MNYTTSRQTLFLLAQAQMSDASFHVLHDLHITFCFRHSLICCESWINMLGTVTLKLFEIGMANIEYPWQHEHRDIL